MEHDRDANRENGGLLLWLVRATAGGGKQPGLLGAVLDLQRGSSGMLFSRGIRMEQIRGQNPYRHVVGREHCALCPPLDSVRCGLRIIRFLYYATTHNNHTARTSSH
jgi:hypothetical protein